MTEFRDIQPPPQLEQRVVNSLRVRRAFSSPMGKRRLTPVLLAAALAFAAFFGGMKAQESRQVSALSPKASRYVLLLYGDSAPDSASRATLTSEFHEWTGRLKQSGQYLQGAELSDESFLVSAGTSAGANEPTGMFVFVAQDSSEAMRIARECPHVRRGGGALLRPVVQ